MSQQTNQSDNQTSTDQPTTDPAVIKQWGKGAWGGGGGGGAGEKEKARARARESWACLSQELNDRAEKNEIRRSDLFLSLMLLAWK